MVKNPRKKGMYRYYSFPEIAVTRLPSNTSNFTWKMQESIAGKGEHFDKVAAYFCRAIEPFC